MLQGRSRSACFKYSAGICYYINNCGCYVYDPQSMVRSRRQDEPGVQQITSLFIMSTRIFNLFYFLARTICGNIVVLRFSNSIYTISSKLFVFLIDTQKQGKLLNREVRYGLISKI